jgi:hypothetical protein
VAFEMGEGGQQRPLSVPVAGVLLNAIDGALDGEALAFELDCALFAIEQVLSIYVDVEPSLYTFVVLACSRCLPIGPPAFGPPADVVVGDGVRGVVFGGECLAGHAARRGATDVVDIELVLLVLLGVLVDEAAALGGGLHVVAQDEVVQLSQRLVKLDLHLTNITV